MASERYYQADSAAQQELQPLRLPASNGNDSGGDARARHDHEGLLSLPRLTRGVVLAWLLVLSTGLLMVGVLLWMGKGPAPLAAAGPPAGAGAGAGAGAPTGVLHGGRKEGAPPAAAAAAAAPVIVGPQLPSRSINYTAAALADVIVDLPGMPPGLAASFRQFSGYLPISTDKRVFYWFVEAAAPLDPATAPLTLWTNGGPGCSGLFGLLEEMGPFRPTKDGRALEANPMSWNRLSNVVFIEIPVGVGFSYSHDPKDYRTGDEVTAQDNLRVVQAFFDRFPHLRRNDFYLASESYGGHYIPQLAQAIVLHNMGPSATSSGVSTGSGGGSGSGSGVRGAGKGKKRKGKRREREEGDKDTYDAAGRINLKGILVGNPYTDPVENLVGMLDSLFGRDLIPSSTYDAWAKTCMTGGPDAYYSKACVDLQNKVWEQLGGDDVDPYALDWPVCVADVGNKRDNHDTAPPRDSDDDEEEKEKESRLAQRAKAAGRNQRHQLAAHAMKGLVSPEVFARPSWSPAAGSDEDVGLPFEPCEEDYATAYLNRQDVKAALHVQADIKWEDCTDRVDYAAGDQLLYMEPLYNFLLTATDGDMRILIISGDDDAVCGTRGTELWLTRMGWKVVTSWRPWHVDGQVAGYKKAFANGVTFLTVHGAGHEVPMYKPTQAFKLYEAFLDDSLDEL